MLERVFIIIIIMLVVSTMDGAHGCSKNQAGFAAHIVLDDFVSLTGPLLVWYKVFVEHETLD